MADERSAVVFSVERPDLAALERLWIDLEARADITFFLSWQWIGTWLVEAGLPDHVLVGRAGGEVVCLGLLRRSLQRRNLLVRSRTLALHQTGTLEEDSIFIEYNDFLTDRRFAPIAPAAIAYLRSQSAGLGSFDELQFGGVEEKTYDAVKGFGYKTYVYTRKPTAFVDLDAVRQGGGDYLATLSSNTRYQIRRALKIYQSRGPLTLQPARSIEEAASFFDALGVLHEGAWRERGEGGGAWRFPFLIQFHKRLLERSFENGGVEIVRISCGDTPVGYIHCLVRDGWIGSYLSGFAYEEDNKVKPGLVSFYLYIEHKLKEGGQVFDFLAGDDRYKTSLGQPGPTMLWFKVQELRPQLLIESALRELKRRYRARKQSPVGRDQR